MIAYEENLQSLRIGAEQEANLQARTAFKYIHPQPPDGDSGMEVRMAEAVRQNSQCLFRPPDVRIA
jgi:hypothetical protein